MLYHVEFAHMLYGSDIKQNEKDGLQRMESAIINTLLDHSIPPSPIRKQSTNPGPHSLKLSILTNMSPQVVIETLAKKTDLLSEEALIALINKNISKI